MANRWGVFFAFAIVYLVWGSTFLALAEVVRYVPPWTAAGSRFLLAGLALYLEARGRRRVSRPTRAQWKNATALGALYFTVSYGGIFWAEAHGLASGTTAVLVSTESLWLVLLSWWMGRAKRPSKGVLFGVSLGFVGVLGLFVPTEAPKMLPSLAVLASALGWSFGSVVAPSKDKHPDSLLWSSMQMLGGGALLLVVSAVRGERPPALGSIPAVAWASFGFLVIFGSMIAFTAYNYLVHAVSPSRLSTYAYANPLVALILGTWAGEAWTVSTWLGAAGILSGVVVTLWQSPPEEKPETEGWPPASSARPPSPSNGSLAEPPSPELALNR